MGMTSVPVRYASPPVARRCLARVLSHSSPAPSPTPWDRRWMAFQESLAAAVTAAVTAAVAAAVPAAVSAAAAAVRVFAAAIAVVAVSVAVVAAAPAYAAQVVMKKAFPVPAFAVQTPPVRVPSIRVQSPHALYLHLTAAQGKDVAEPLPRQTRPPARAPGRNSRRLPDCPWPRYHRALRRRCKAHARFALRGCPHL